MWNSLMKIPTPILVILIIASIVGFAFLWNFIASYTIGLWLIKGIMIAIIIAFCGYILWILGLIVEIMKDIHRMNKLK